MKTFFQIQDWDSEANWDFDNYKEAKAKFDSLVEEGYTNLRLRELDNDGDEIEILHSIHGEDRF